jgi:hypothetical protein
MILKLNTLYRVDRNQLVNHDGSPKKSLYVVGAGDVTVRYSPEKTQPFDPLLDMQVDDKTYIQNGSPYTVIADFEWIYITSTANPDFYIMGMAFKEA